MNVLVLGGGGREHAIIKALRKNPTINRIYCTPGNDGMDGGTPFPIAADNFSTLIRFAKTEHVEYIVVSPDNPLVEGAVDRFTEAGFRCFGPTKAAAQLEGSKIFAKAFMKRHEIPTARYEAFSTAQNARDYIHTEASAGHLPLVIKADGLALGKGVVIAESEEEAQDTITRFMEQDAFGESGHRLIVEEFMEGPEVTVLTLTDGKTIVPLLSSMDHKRAYDGDKGPNTGGMGVIAPNPFYTSDIADVCRKTIFEPTIKGMCEEGMPFKGCLYFGLMLTKEGPKVVEYNCRFGDPEAQAILPLLESDLFTLFQAVSDETLSEDMVRFTDGASCCVILASKGYPKQYEKNVEITLPRHLRDKIFCAGVRKKGSTYYTNGGRVVGVVETAPTLHEAITKAYETAEEISFRTKFFRTDIGQKALEALERSQA